MGAMGTMDEDRKLVGEAVANLVDRAGVSRGKFATDVGISRPTLYRVLGGEEGVSLRVLRKIEEGLSLPYDTLLYIALHDWESLTEIGVSRDLVQWVSKRADTGVDAP